MTLRWIGVILAAATVASCGGGDNPPADVPADSAEAVDPGDVGPTDPGVEAATEEVGGRDESQAEEVSLDEGTDLEADAADDAEAEVEVPCVPDCEDRQCGSDGCDGVCGFCEYGFLCVPATGQCKEYCEKKCDGKVCGPDGCGGDCPPGCEDNEECSPIFTCVPKSCVKQCDGKVCGPDGCGLTCGECGDGFVCTKDGQCTEDTSCHEVTEIGQCIGSERQWCEGAVLKKEVCDTAAGYVCGYDNNALKYMCRKPEVCVPQCTGKVCGPDGCPGDGTCGTCEGDLVCSDGGECGEACGGITATGQCMDLYTLVFCDRGILKTYYCNQVVPPLECRFNAEATPPQYDCL